MKRKGEDRPSRYIYIYMFNTGGGPLDRHLLRGTLERLWAVHKASFCELERRNTPS